MLAAPRAPPTCFWFDGYGLVGFAFASLLVAVPVITKIRQNLFLCVHVCRYVCLPYQLWLYRLWLYQLCPYQLWLYRLWLYQLWLYRLWPSVI